MELGEKPDALPAHATPADMDAGNGYGETAVGVGGEPTYMKYGPTATGGLGAQGSGVVNHGGYQTTTTTNSHTNGTF